MPISKHIGIAGKFYIVLTEKLSEAFRCHIVKNIGYEGITTLGVVASAVNVGKESVYSVEVEYVACTFHKPSIPSIIPRRAAPVLILQIKVKKTI